MGGDGVVLLVRAGSGGEGVGWPGDGGHSRGSMCGSGPAAPGCGRPAAVCGRPVGLWWESGCLLASGALLLARGSCGVLCLGPVDQVCNKVTETRSCSLLRFVEWAAKPSQHAWATRVGGLLCGSQEAEYCPEAAGGGRLAAMSCSSSKRQLGAEHSVDEPLPRSSLRPGGLVMALEHCTRVCGCNNGRCIVLKGR